MSGSPLFLALDAGTTSFKAILFDADGHVMAHERAEIRLHHPQPLWAEVDAEDWWRAAVERVPRLFAGSGAASDAVAAIGVTGAMHALVPVGAEGAVVGPTLTWFDQRCRPQVQALQERSAAFEPVGGISIASSSARLRWLRERGPEVVERAHCFLLPKDFLRQRLTGRFVTDPSDARSTSMIDRHTGDWCRALIEGVLEVPAGKLPEIRPAAEIAGSVTGTAAAALGLRSGTPVAVGMGDVPATLLGIDAFRPGQLSIYLGTGGWMARTLPCESDTTPATAWVGSTMACGSALNWARGLVLRADGGAGAPAAYAAVEQAVASVPAGSDGLLFLPHLMGERGRGGNPNARGAFHGLTLGHTPAHLLRAVIEGIAFQLQQEIEAAVSAAEGEGSAPHPEHKATAWQPLPHEPVTLSGGAARSEQWRRIIADVTGRSVSVPAVPDTTALGAAVVAATAVGHFSSLRAGTAAWVRPGARTEPSAGAAATYAAVYERYCALEAVLHPLSATPALGNNHDR